MNESPSFVIRRFQPDDRAAVRALCADTGFLGSPIDPVFEDRELFANFLTGYYLDWEPESTFLLEAQGRVMGYAMACRFPAKKTLYEALHYPLWAGRILRRWPRYSPASRRYLAWVLRRGSKETPPAPRGISHFHFNVLPEARGVAQTRALVDAMLEHLVRCGEKAVYAQMVAVGRRREERTLNRYGFARVNKSEVTKYRGIHPEPVYLVTIQKDLTANSKLYGVDLAKEKDPA